MKERHVCQSALWAIKREREARGPEALRALRPLHEHHDYGLRVEAAGPSHPVFPDGVQRRLRHILDLLLRFDTWRVPSALGRSDPNSVEDKKLRAIVEALARAFRNRSAPK